MITVIKYKNKTYNIRLTINLKNNNINSIERNGIKYKCLFLHGIRNCNYANLTTYITKVIHAKKKRYFNYDIKLFDYT